MAHVPEDGPMPERRRKCRSQAARGGGTAGEVVYFVRAGAAIKIGRTANLAARLRALATASAVPLELLAAVPGGREREVREHRGWRHLRLRGEWFRPDGALVRYARGQGAGPARRLRPRPPRRRSCGGRWRRWTGPGWRRPAWAEGVKRRAGRGGRPRSRPPRTPEVAWGPS
jgi:hypothetical protein